MDNLIERLRTGRRYVDYSIEEAERRLARRQAARVRCSNPSCAPTSAPAVSDGPQWLPSTLDGKHSPDQAVGDLRAICTLVMGAADAVPDLVRFFETHYADGPGARVLACLLHLTGDRNGARWWWQFGAGAGDDTAAYCLLLDHARRGELYDALFWGRQLVSSGFVPEQLGSRAEAPMAVEDLPDRVSPHINKKFDVALGAIPLPEPSLVIALQELASVDAGTR
ncbi:hypothetical protein [Kitasatospora indigofera]|uniref:hypothetical protein n=1 Tax=Kitasatospora indigofera TaxID=67307 RepID=UPI0036C4F642